MFFNEANVPLYRTIDCLSTPTARSTNTDIENTRLLGECPLPPTYREWARLFGHGETAKILLLRVPLSVDHPSSLPRWASGVKQFLLEGIERRYYEYGPHGSPELVRRLVPFGQSIDGDYLTWDPDDRSGDEYAVYVIGPKMLSIVRGGNDFVDFLGSCWDERLKDTLGSYPSLPRTFKPTELRW